MLIALGKCGVVFFSSGGKKPKERTTETGFPPLLI